MGHTRRTDTRLCATWSLATLTFLGALHCDSFTAPCLFDGPINGECFRAYVEQILLPSLKPGDIVVMDNLGSHKAAALRRLIKAAGARLWYLPPYSPDLNPIEQTFAKDQALDAIRPETYHRRRLPAHRQPRHNHIPCRMQ
jgi:hypothetical protein